MRIVETLRVVHMANDGAILDITEHSSHLTDRVVVPVRQVVADALRLDSQVLMLAHNHPNGDPTPSRADIATTRRIATVANALGIRLHDHIVTSGARTFSFRAAGLL